MKHIQSNDYTNNYMISFAKAQQLIIDNTPTSSSESLAINKSSGRVLAEPIFTSTAIPQFDNAAMDGYAVNSADLELADEKNPVNLTLIGLTAAGDFIDNHSSPQNTRGKAWKIMTGAPVPTGFDSIIPVENTATKLTVETDKAQTVQCYASAVLGAHIRRRGEDFKANSSIASVGTIINTNTIMALAAHGISQVSVYRKINISLFSTGKEVIDDPAQALKPGQIRNSNKPFIIDWLKPLPTKLFDAGTNKDNVEQFEKDLQAELNKKTDIIISSGAVSMGDFDFIPKTIKKLGGEIIFHKLKMRPGKPLLFARFSNGSLYFGLPGNPISSAVGLRFFVSSAIRKLQGLQQEASTSAITTSPFKKKAGVRSILKAFSQVNSNAQLAVSILDGQESFKIAPLLNANGWAILPEAVERTQKGELIQFYPTEMNWG